MMHRSYQTAVLLSVAVGIPDFAEPPRRVLRLGGDPGRPAGAIGCDALADTLVDDPRLGDRAGAEEGGRAPGGYARRLPRWFPAAASRRRRR